MSNEKIFSISGYCNPRRCFYWSQVAVTTTTNKLLATAKQVLKIGATAVPHAEILEQVKPILAKEGIELKITEFTDYNTPNLALGDKEIDANFFQHVPYMDEFANLIN